MSKRRPESSQSSNQPSGVSSRGRFLEKHFEQLTTALLVVDVSWHVIDMNQACETLFSTSRNRLESHLAASFFSLATFNLDGLPIGSSLREANIQLKVADKIKVVDCTVTAFKDTDEKQYYLMELTTPKSDLLAFSQEQSSLRQQEQYHLLTKSLAHEIKNPLGGIRGAAQLLGRAFQDETLAEYTEVIIREADRLKWLVDRLSSTDYTTEFRAFNIHEVVERVRILTEAEKPQGVKVIRDYDPSIPEFEGNPEMLIQAVLNISQNALRALGKTGQMIFKTRTKRNVTLGERCHRLVAEMSICDDGPGIPNELKEAIFYPFVSGSEEGSGLGLSIAQAIIVQHHGQIVFKSEPGETIFRVFLPLELSDDNDT